MLGPFTTGVYWRLAGVLVPVSEFLPGGVPALGAGFLTGGVPVPGAAVLTGGVAVPVSEFLAGGVPVPVSKFLAGVIPVPGAAFLAGAPVTGAIFLASVPVAGTAFLTGVPAPGDIFLAGVPTPGAAFLAGVPTPGAAFLAGVPTPGAAFLASALLFELIACCFWAIISWHLFCLPVVPGPAGFRYIALLSTPALPVPTRPLEVTVDGKVAPCEARVLVFFTVAGALADAGMLFTTVGCCFFWLGIAP